MRYYLRATYNAAIRMFRTGDTKESERLDAENAAILADVHRQRREAPVFRHGEESRPFLKF